MTTPVPGIPEGPNNVPPTASGLANDVATAPGDLPVADLLARAALQREQFRHDNTITPLAPGANEPVLVEATAGELLPLAWAAVFYTTDGSLPDAGSASVSMELAAVDWDVRSGFLARWRAELPPQPGGTVVRYRIGGSRAGAAASPAHVEPGVPDIWAHDGQGFWFRSPWPAGLSTFAYIARSTAELQPAWASEAVIYQIFVDRFHPGTPDGRFKGKKVGKETRHKHGGNLRGIRQALPYLSDLGVTCLWLSPVCDAPSYHRYDATDFYALDPVLGSNDDLRELVRDAHAQGIRIVLDFVPSHCSSRHPAFVAAQHDPNAPSFSWFTFHEWPNSYRSFLETVRSLPSFNTEDPGARDYLIGSAVYWMREFGVDGYRIDHAIGPGMDFWVALRNATAQVSEESILFGEATDTPDSLRRYRGRLHGVLDFPLAMALRHVFALHDWDLDRFVGYLDSYEAFMETGPGRLSFLDNHDMNRFLFLAGNSTNRLKLAALCQFTLAATPIVYYGTEIGMSQEYPIEAPGRGGDAQVRADMPWDPASWYEGVLAFYRALISLRREHPVLVYGKRRTIYLKQEDGVFGYARSAADGSQLTSGDMLVLFNVSDTPRALELPLQRGQRLLPLFQTGPQTVSVQLDGAQVAIMLPAETGLVLWLDAS